MYKWYCRIFQWIMRWASYFLPWRRPELIKGEKSIDQLPAVIKKKGLTSLIVVTDPGISSLGLMNGLLQGFRDEGIDPIVYDKTVPNPTIDNIEEAVELYQINRCDGIVAFGGGSSMDCAKGVGARIARPRKTISQMKGLFKVMKRIPPLVAIPTTAGTGSETTLAAVITDSRTHEKYALNDLSLIPHYAVLDPTLTEKLPPHLTATTGMDALTHAVEAYIGRSNTSETRRQAREAVALIFENLPEAYAHGSNLQARAHMQKASFLAGLAFTRAYVGYVHAIAHTLGGFYSVPHGLANAVILPYVLEYYGASAQQPLAELADCAGVSQADDTVEQKAAAFIAAVKKLNAMMGIPPKIRGMDNRDISLMVQRALAESNPLYPVPKIMSEVEMVTLFHQIKES